MIEDEDQAWFGAKLSSAESKRGIKIGSDFLRTRRECSRKKEKRIGAGHFREEGNRISAF